MIFLNDPDKILQCFLVRILARSLEDVNKILKNFLLRSWTSSIKIL